MYRVRQRNYPQGAPLDHKKRDKKVNQILGHSYIVIFQKNTLCHSFRIIVIPSVLLSFLPDYCHSFRSIVIPSVLVSFLPNIVIPSELFRELQILTSSKSFPYPKGEKNGHRRWPYMRVYSNILCKCAYFLLL